MERYEILGQIAVGDFATIYRARDRELLREVAIKQIHNQYLADPRQLERFWREAQLLASLQHPHIITIYDVVRPRGWLVMELMQGSLRDLVRDEPLDVDFVRTVLASCLDALRFLHAQGILHGDIKPSNVLIDRDGRVKLGDFGLARRATSQEGSLLKGTTKYLAPEVVSAQFGEVGPASDLYSLGFMAYELLCGSRFRDLFPGLASFGRDEQLAWLMWHSAPDLRLPPVQRVLQGVPADLARVIDRLVQKEQSQRFSSAEEALAQLAMGGPGMPPPRVVEPKKPPEAPPPPRWKKRVVAGAAVLASAVVTLFLLWPQSPPPPAAPPPTWGTIRVVDIGDRRLEILPDDARKILEIRISPGDEFVLNFKSVSARELREGDRVKVELIKAEDGRSARRVTAFRPENFQGVVTEIHPAAALLNITHGEDNRPLTLRLGEDTKVWLNNDEISRPTPGRWGVLNTGDQVAIVAVPDESGWHAREVRAVRLMTFEGIVDSVDRAATRLVWRSGGSDGPVQSAVWAKDCVVRINGQTEVFGKKVSVVDLQPGDKVTLEADTLIRRIEAHRIFEFSGTVAAVLLPERMVRTEEPLPVSQFLVTDATKLSLEGEEVSLGDLRPGDRIRVRLEDISSGRPPVLELVATRPPDPRRWALLIGVTRFDDAALTHPPATQTDLSRLADRLQRRYRVPVQNVSTLINPGRQELEEALRQLPQRTRGGEQLIVFVLTNAYLDEQNNPFLAPRDFRFQNMADTGVDLRWVVQQLEACEVANKVLLLDVCRAGSGADLIRQPSSAEIVLSLSPRKRRLPLRSVVAVASCSPGERGLVDQETGSSLFAREVIRAYEGQADVNRDGQLEVNELFDYLQRSVSARAQSQGGKQTPRLFLPDTSPPRLSEEAKASIRRLAGFLSQQKPDLNLAKQEYDSAIYLAKDEPEPRILYALLLMRNLQRDEAALILAELRVRRPELLVVRHAFVWLELERRNTAGAARTLLELAELLAKISTTEGVVDPFYVEIAEWAGRLREYTASLDGFDDWLIKVDVEMARCAPSLHLAYEEGRQHTQRVLKKFDAEMAVADPLDLPRLRMERRLLRNYATFPYEVWVRRIVEGMEDE